MAADVNPSTMPTLGPRPRPDRVRSRRRVVVALMAVFGVMAVALAVALGSAPPEPIEESLDTATFFDDRVDPDIVAVPEVVRGDDIEEPSEPTEPHWERLVPEPGDGVLVATSLPELAKVEIWAGPAETEPIAWELAVPTEFGSLRHLQVLSETEDFVEVKVPVRPNGSTGWVRKSDLTFSVTQHRIEIVVSERTLQVFEGDVVVFETTGAVGRDEYPTPVGEWFLRDIIPWDPDSVYGPWVLALSAFSEQIDEINGGQAVVALHGTNQPDRIGGAVSLGCVRLSNDDITTVAYMVPVGSPVIIIA